MHPVNRDIWSTHMDDFATLFTYLVLALTGFAFAALAGFIVWDVIVDARRLGRRDQPRLPRLPAAEAPIPRDWIQPSKAA
jgi:hypothetical protein